MGNLFDVQFKNFIVYIFILIGNICTSEVPRPRGVSLSRASLYNPSENFACFDGSLTIPFSQVNDDYCDCSDGSDEPGTSACPNGIFHCSNAGYKPLNIASSRVNDGVCDCCDASDEYANKNGNCQNTCNELGRHAREEAQRKSELFRIGKELRTELIQQGIQLKQSKKDKLAELEKNKIEAEKVKLEKEESKKIVEELENVALQKYREIEEEEKRLKMEQQAIKNREEATEIFEKYDSNGNGRIEIEELKTREVFDKDRNGEVSDEEAKFFLADKDSVDLEEFVTEAWAKIKPFAMLKEGLFKPPESETPENSEEPKYKEIEDVDEGEEGEEIESDTEDEEEEEHHEEEKVEDPVPEQTKYDEETQKLIDEATEARKIFDEADREVRNIESELKGIKEYLEKDFGPEEEFATLEGQCFDFSDYEYIYKLCPFDRTVQTPKSNSVETRLGTWSNWVGPEDDKYSVMLYDRGQSCWNGPQRTTHVTVHCGSTNRVTSVSEPNRCEYLFVFESPAACRDTESDNSSDIHDEL